MTSIIITGEKLSANGHSPKSGQHLRNQAYVSLIIAVYKRVDFLELVLMSVENQTFRHFEVIIAEDDQSDDIKEFIRRRGKSYSFPIIHTSHEDQGFRKNKSLNRAVMASKGEHLIFIDGDCILHKKFIEEHAKRFKPDTCLFGRRATLSINLTNKLSQERNIDGLSFMSMLLTKTRHLEDGIYIPWLPSFRKFGVKGSNFSLGRELLFKINGFDEDFEKPYGGEDTDIERRLRLINIKFKCTKFKTIQYHLHHDRVGRKNDWETEGGFFYQKKIDEGLWYCKNGLSKYKD